MTGKTDKRKKIIKAALRLLTKQGFHAAPMSMIADKASVGAGTIYNYFENKDVLIRAIFFEIENEIVVHLGRGSGETKNTKERFIRFWTMLLNYLIAHPDNFSYLEQFHNSPFGVSLRRDRLAGNDREPPLFADIMKDGMAKGEIRDLPVAMLCALAFGPIQMMARDHALGFIKLDEALIKQGAEACWDSIKE
jgi:TetR/AcrR family transcriptional regulator, repressor of fatR-cypB operon